MAIKNTKGSFNPDVQDVQIPSYLGLSNSITQYDTPSPLGVALKGAASLIDKTVQAADDLVKNDAGMAVEKNFEPMRDEYTQALEGATKYAQAVTKPQISSDPTRSMTEGGSYGGAPIQAGDLPPEQFAENQNLDSAPKEIKALPGKLDALGSARADGKISETDFWGRLAAEAKDVRSRYPVLYRPYVDELIARKFGTTPANAYVQGMIRDINASLTNSQHEKNATLAFIRTHIGEDGADKIYEQLDNNSISSPEAMSRIAVPLRQKTRIERAHAELNLDKADFEYKGQIYERTANTIANAVVDKAMSSMTSATGFSGQRLQDIVNDFNAGNIKLKGTQGQELARQTQVLIDKAKAEIDENYNRDAKFGPIANVVDGGKLNTIKEAQLNKLIRVRDGFFKGDLSIAADAPNFAKSAADDSKYQLLQMPQINKAFLLMDNLKSMGAPENVVNKLSERLITGGEFMKEWNDYVRAQTTDLITPSTTTKDWTTLKQAITDQKFQQKKWNIDAPTTYHALSNIVDGPNISLANSNLGPNTKAIHNQIITTTFGPGNENVLKLIKTDTRDDRGNVVPGAQSWFYRFTDPNVVKNVHAFGKDSPQESMYLNWIDKTVNEDLLRVDLTNLKKYNLSDAGPTGGNPFIPDAPTAPGNSRSQNWRIMWNTEQKNFDLEVNGRVISGAGLKDAYTRGGVYGPGVQAAGYIANINKVLTGLRRVAEGIGREGDDVDAFVLRPLINSATSEQLRTVPGLPSKLLDSINSAYIQQQMDRVTSENARKAQGRKNRGDFTTEDRMGM